MADLAVAVSPADRSQAALCRLCRLRLTASIPTNSKDIDRPVAPPPRIQLLCVTKATQLSKDISQEEGLSRNLGIAISSAWPLEHLPDASALRPSSQQLALNRSTVHRTSTAVGRCSRSVIMQARTNLARRHTLMTGSAKLVCAKIAKPPSASGRPAWRRRPDSRW